jgi:hypothetical protein
MYNERASAITIGFVELLRNILTAATYIKNIQKNKRFKCFISYLGIGFK